MTALHEQVKVWRAAPFPSTTLNDGVDELHKDLILYDSWVAESVIPFVETGRFEPAVPDVVATLDEFLGRAVALASKVSGSDLDSLREQMDYARRLKEIYRNFLAVKAR